MINKPFEQIEKADIQSLVTDEVREGRMLEYKEKLPGGSDSEKIEFLADISSFANASGGYIIYGVRERRAEDQKPTGAPESADGVEGINTDSDTLRLESMIRTGIEPRISGIQTKPIEGFSRGPVLLLRIPKSLASPHMITFKNHARFYSRSSNGKYPLDITEIRAAFALSESLVERIRHFRDDRIAKIIGDEMPVPMIQAPKIALHLVPIASLSAGWQLDVVEIYKERDRLRPIGPGDGSHRVNFDGVVTFYYYSNPSECYSYVQAFRTGAIEAVDADLFHDQNGKKVQSEDFEKDLVSALSRFLKLQETLGIEPPVFVMISLLDVKDYTLAVGKSYSSSSARPIDRNTLFLPELIIEQYGQDPAAVLRPAFDAVWQASGFLRSGNYDKNGKWVVK